MLDEFLFLFSAVEEKVVTYYEKKNRPSLKGCYVKRDRKVYPAGAVWHPYVQPFGYMRCHACTCMVSGGTTYKKRAHTARAFLSLGPTLFYVRVIPKKERFWRSVGIPRVFGQQYKRKCTRLFLTVPLRVADCERNTARGNFPGLEPNYHPDNLVPRLLSRDWCTQAVSLR